MKKHEFWPAFLLLLKEKGVSEKARPWYRRHLEAWGSFRRAKRSEGQDPEIGAILQLYLEKLGRSPQFADWQIGQVLDSIQWAHSDSLSAAWIEIGRGGISAAELTAPQAARW